MAHGIQPGSLAGGQSRCYRQTHKSRKNNESARNAHPRMVPSATPTHVTLTRASPRSRQAEREAVELLTRIEE
ncbi:MAG: hypothetical protein JWL79_2122 [Frankiales bacterium]|nr:hypothetical protein [Frankiales bacterium]